MADDRPRAVGPELGSLLSYAFLVFLLFFAANILVDALPSESLGGPDRVRILADKISSATSEAWRFGRPILQLIVILVLLQWILRRLGLSLQLQSIPLTWDIRALLAILVVAAFSLAPQLKRDPLGSTMHSRVATRLVGLVLVAGATTATSCGWWLSARAPLTPPPAFDCITSTLSAQSGVRRMDKPWHGHGREGNRC